MVVAVPVVTVGKVAAATVNDAVAPVLVSVIVSVQADDPQVSVAVAVVFDVIVGEPILSPVHPEPATESVSAATDQIEFDPVKVIVPWQAVVHPPEPGVPEVGEIVKVSVATWIVVLTESVVSVIVSVPVLEPVANWQVPEVAVFVQLLMLTPETPETVKVALEVRPVPVIVIVNALAAFAGTVAGETLKLAVPETNW
jgi:hypothetical protein